MSPLIFDVFPYNGDEILPFRLEYFYPYVDYFIILESKETFSGLKKDSYYIDKTLPSIWKYVDKLIIVKTDKLPPRPSDFNISSNNNPDDWWREWSLRETSKPHIRELASSNPFVVMSGDVDEFPPVSLIQNKEELYRIVGDDYTYLGMDFFYYNFNWVKKNKWDQYYLKNDKAFFDRFLSERKIFQQGKIINTGWHFSYFMSRENIIKKIQSIGHTEINKPEFIASDHIDMCLKTGKDLFLRPNEDCIRFTDFQSLPDGSVKFQKILDRIQLSC